MGVYFMQNESNLHYFHSALRGPLIPGGLLMQSENNAESFKFRFDTTE